MLQVCYYTAEAILLGSIDMREELHCWQQVRECNESQMP